MKLQLENRKTIADINPADRHIIISMTDRASNAAFVRTNENTVAMLQSFFWDVDSETKDGDRIVSFTNELADEILDFVFDNKDNIDRIIAHCDAGQCRSPAVLAAFDRIFHGSDDVWFQTKRPNRLVYRTLLNRAVERNLWVP